MIYEIHTTANPQVIGEVPAACTARHEVTSCDDAQHNVRKSHGDTDASSARAAAIAKPSRNSEGYAQRPN